MIDHQDLTVYFILKKVICNTKRKEMTRVITPLWPLLLMKNEFFRDDVVHRAAFENAKQILASGQYVTFFDLKSLMRIITNASQVGLLQKQHAEWGWKMVQAGSIMMFDWHGNAIRGRSSSWICWPLRSHSIRLGRSWPEPKRTTRQWFRYSTAIGWMRSKIRG